MTIKLISLVLDNFKGFQHARFEFGGRDAAIYGANGAGKTSVYDGLTWLLFGKDSRGKSDFDIKPLSPDGAVKDHGAITSVEAVFSIDGVEKKLTRTYREVWSQKRGNPEAAFDGHTSEYAIDGVPMKKNEFARQVGDIVEEDTFRLLTSVSYFAEELPWQKRRATLFDVAAVATDDEIMASDSRFALLAEAMDGLPLDDFKKKITAQRRGLNRDLDDIPARLDECKKTVEDLGGINFGALEEQKAQAQSRRDALQQELDQATLDGGRMSLQNQLAAARNELARLENENYAFRLMQRQQQGDDEVGWLRRSQQAAADQQARRQREMEYLQQKVRRLESEIADCRAAWDAANGQTFQGGICPACGQALPKDKLEAAMDAFERSKARQKSDAVEKANKAKEDLENARQLLAQMEEQQAEHMKQATEREARLRQLESEPTPALADLRDYASKKAALEADIGALTAQLDGLDKQTAARRKSLLDALEGAEQELRQIAGQLAKRSALEYAQGRMDELRQQAAAASDQLNKLDGMFFLCEEFLRYKAQFVEQSVNRRFSLARFRLFRQQINGGLEDCCDVTVDGVPYSSGLNTGARVNAGVDIINVLSRHYGVHVPLFVDNAESVSRLEPADTQVIRLVVSENDKKMRCEVQ